MPRKTKEPENSEKKESLLKSILSHKKETSKKTDKVKKTSSSKNKVSKDNSKRLKPVSKKDTEDIKSSTKKEAKKGTKKATSSKKPKTETKKITKSSVSSKKTTSSKIPKTETKKATSSNKPKVETKKVNKSSVSKKASTSSKKNLSSSKKAEKQNFSLEYYDLPYRYNQTIVRILAQTPKNLFVYWDISDEDRNSLISHFGEHFFEITKPVLIVHNETMNYSFEVDVNDFTNSWYLNINDSDCKYSIELGRRPIPINYNYIQNYNKEKDDPIQPIETSYIYISSSNDLETPNDKILFRPDVKKIYFKNIKTNKIIEKDISAFPFVYKNGKFIGIYGIYSKLFKDEEILSNNSIINNPSSGNPSSGTLSSRFK